MLLEGLRENLGRFTIPSLQSANGPQIRQQPRTRGVGRNPYAPLLSHTRCNYGYTGLFYELLQPLLQSRLQLLDGKPSRVNFV